MSDDSTTPSLTEFPYAPENWSPHDCKIIADDEGIDLTADHWAVIQCLQEYFARNDGHVNVRKIQDALHERFHHIGGRQGCRLAGLKPPPGSVDPSFGSVY